MWLLLLILTFGSEFAFAKNELRGGLGIYRWTSDQTNPFHVEVSGLYEFNSRHGISPEIGYILPDERLQVRRSHYFFNLDYVFSFHPNIRLRSGPGLVVRKVEGTGTANETDSYADCGSSFSQPSKTNTGYAYSANFGFEGHSAKAFFKVDSYFFQIFDQKRRSYALAFTFGFIL